MSWFKSMDLYKGVILVSLLLLPVVGWWIKSLDDRLAVAERELRAAKRPGGYLEEIGELQKKIETVETNRVTGSATGQHGIYFQGQIFKAAQGIDQRDFSIGAQVEERAMTGSRQRAIDYVVDVDWPKRSGKEFPMSREVLFAVLFNCESGAGGSLGAASVWKLRNLHVINETAQKSMSRTETPPQPLEDNWVVREMKFARREPVKDS